MKTSCYLFLLFGLFTAGCASAGGGATSGNTTPPTKTASVHLDLAKYRPTFPVSAEPATPAAPARPLVEPTHHINQQLHARLDSISESNLNIRYAQGYRILVYSLNERKQAMDLRKAITQRLPEETDYFTYQQPTFRLKVGDYLSRLEARAVLDQIKDIAPNAMVIPDQIFINKAQAKKENGQ